jgi:hypothetical protein
VDQHVVADQRELNGGLGADIAVAADLDVGPDHRAGPDDGARADLDPRADHDQRIDDDAVLEARGGIDDRRRRDAFGTEPGLRPQRVGVPLAGEFDEHLERFRGPQHGGALGHLRLEARADQAGAGLGGGELVGIFEIIEEGEMHRTGLVERGQPPDLKRSPSRGRPVAPSSARRFQPALTKEDS